MPCWVIAKTRLLLNLVAGAVVQFAVPEVEIRKPSRSLNQVNKQRKEAEDWGTRSLNLKQAKVDPSVEECVEPTRA